ncbi:cytidylate kinase-like family protein [Treponema parvum]|uniref:Cytidylate kinase-like family protein n=1 Tax=Treponema parvum TaxID=138851 RepID=A0A975F0Q2_9SPIR|nr:cytidylate kinase-like family protein [Treponema parvum]QTQ12431.1 cytidylate kinase-like family protein [Treponema parvum]
MAVIAISRQIAALGDEIAEATAKKLKYAFIDRKEIERRIISLGFPAETLKKYDEKKPGFFASLAKERDEYLDYLQIAILEAAAEGNCILIGRGAFIILEQLSNLLALRVVAKDSVRLSRLQKEFGIDEKQARQRINESDANRLGFHKSFFNLENEDPSHFHLILNTGLLDIDTASGIIADLVRTSVTPEKEEAGKKRIEELICAQRLVNSLVFEYKMNISFLHAAIEGKAIVLQGVADSSAIVEKALAVSHKILPDYSITSAISIVQDFKAHP